ncbi:MAG: hypothetical protein KatS3mg010_0359 [Acidimicrobiia bacterium]|nr:MAG: hypothetical protein KatS3mg010_0359 [Acidimicrobiia bacterium]
MGAGRPGRATSRCRARGPRCRNGEHRRAHVGVQPLVGSSDVLRVHREARREHLARRLGRVAQAVERGPRSLGVDVVDRHGRNPAPVVDARGDERREVVAEVGRRLEVDVGRQHQARHGDRPEELVGRARLRAVHRGTRLRQEVLDDDLLHVPVAFVRGGDREQRVEPFFARLADADEDARRERDTRPPRGLERREPSLRGLVGGAVVRTSRFAEARRERLDHHPLRRADRAQALDLRLRQRACVRVGEQARLVEHELRGRHEVVDGARATRCARATRPPAGSAPRAPRPG